MPAEAATIIITIQRFFRHKSMQHLIEFNEKGWKFDFENYFKKIHDIKKHLSDSVFTFASAIENYDSSSHHSLHDAWLESLKITELAKGSRSENRSINIEIDFLGAYHDLHILLKYENVSSYNLQKNNNPILPPFVCIGHGDLLVHEFSIDEPNFVHELLFSSGAILKIACEKFSTSIVPIV